LTWRIGLDPGTAREKVRVARALGALPKIDEAFAGGRLSYAKVRAVTRIATAGNEDGVLQAAMAATGAQLERICRRLRRATDDEREMAENRRFRGRALGDGLVKLELVLTSDEADLVVAAVERAREQVARAKDASPRPSAADGLMDVVSAYLAGGGATSEPATSPRADVVVHVESDLTAPERTLAASLEDGTPVSAETLRRVACDGGLIAVALDHDRGVLDVGRRTRAIPAAIRRALWVRDGGCRFPGCGSQRFLHGHHVHHWLHGGPTALANLVFLCSFHHRLVHEGGFSISLTDEAEVVVRAPDGRDVSAETRDDAAVEWRDYDWTAPGAEVMPVPSWNGEPIDYEWATDALWAASPE
jgi:hypothetical protein